MLYPVARIISDTPTHELVHAWGRLSLPADVLEILEFLGSLPASFSFFGVGRPQKINTIRERVRGLMLGVPAALREGAKKNKGQVTPIGLLAQPRVGKAAIGMTREPPAGRHDIFLGRLSPPVPFRAWCGGAESPSDPPPKKG